MENALVGGSVLIDFPFLIFSFFIFHLADILRSRGEGGGLEGFPVSGQGFQVSG